MREIARAIVIAAIVLGGAVVVRGTFGTDRYELVPSIGGAVYRLDRLTGGVAICTRAACRLLPTMTPRVAKPPAGPPPTQGPSTREPAATT